MLTLATSYEKMFLKYVPISYLYSSASSFPNTKYIFRG
jgi:hypothetical protein